MSEKDWNINKGFGDLLTGLIDDVNKAAREGDILLWFNSLRILYRNVAGHKKIKAKEMKEIDIELKEIRDKLNNPPAITNKGKAYQNHIQSDVKNSLDDINIKLITEMHKAGLILPIYKNTPEFAAMEI
jgi:2C-methyl-D-erythritol 2,4-cyclodiphosphate synthase